jgi:hypothetical protein
MTDWRTGEEAWRALYAVVRDDELLLAMRASSNPACQWFIGWMDEIYYPWQDGGKRRSLHPPARHATQFFPLIERAIAAARDDMAATATAFAKLWPPAWPSDLPDVPMLPGVAEWPEQLRPRKSPPRKQRRRQ